MATFPKVFNPPPSREKTTNSSLIKKAIVFLFTIVLLAGLGYLFFFSAIFQIKNIIVDENLKSDSSSPVYNWEILKNKNIFILRTANIKKEILKNSPDLIDIKIVRGLPDTLKIEGRQDQAEIIWLSQDRKYFVNSEGMIFQEVNGQTDLPIVQDEKNLAVSLRQAVASKNFVDFVNNLNNRFFLKVGFKIVYFRVRETVFQIDALTDEGFYIKFDTTRNIEDQLNGLSKFLEGHKEEVHEYADVRVEGRVYYK